MDLKKQIPNWKSLRKSYPKAATLAMDWNMKNFHFPITMRLIDLLPFFWENDIVIMIDQNKYFISGPSTEIPGIRNIYSWDFNETTRTYDDILVIATNKAFEMLEDLLNGIQT